MVRVTGSMGDTEWVKQISNEPTYTVKWILELVWIVLTLHLEVCLWAELWFLERTGILRALTMGQLSWASRHCPLVANEKSSQKVAPSTKAPISSCLPSFFFYQNKADVGGLVHKWLVAELVNLVKHLHPNLSSLLTGGETAWLRSS
jgi:hypothetical protein